MKPKDLKATFTWSERRPLLNDGVFYVPAHYSDHQDFPFPDFSTLFPNNNPVIIEYCSGNGTWIADRALKNPETNWVAVEMKFDRVRKIWSKMKNHQISNLFIICGEALTVSKHYFKDQVFSGAYINFPDPWPKKRHAKHRLMREEFTSEVKRVLKPGAVLTLVTDDADYSSQAIDVMNHPQSGFESEYPAPYYLADREGYGDSYFHSLWKERGRTIRFHRFANKKVLADACAL